VSVSQNSVDNAIDLPYVYSEQTSWLLAGILTPTSGTLKTVTGTVMTNVSNTAQGSTRVLYT
jgi:hypothetical protein